MVKQYKISDIHEDGLAGNKFVLADHYMALEVICKASLMRIDYLEGELKACNSTTTIDTEQKDG